MRQFKIIQFLIECISVCFSYLCFINLFTVLNHFHCYVPYECQTLDIHACTYTIFYLYKEKCYTCKTEVHCIVINCGITLMY